MVPCKDFLNLENICWPLQLDSVMMSLTAEKGCVITSIVDRQLKVSGEFPGELTGTVPPGLMHNPYSR